MIMADVWKIVFLILGTQAVLVSYWLLAAALFPDALRRTRRSYETRAGRLTLTGAVITVPAVLIASGLLQAPHPVPKLFGALLASALLALGLAGSAGLSDRIGAGIPGPADARFPWRRVLRGGVVLSFAFVLPILGWFVLLPWTLVTGVAAALGAMRGRRRETSPPAIANAIPSASPSAPAAEPAPFEQTEVERVP